MAEFLKKGFQRVKVDGTFHEIAEAPRAGQEAQARQSTWWWTGSWWRADIATRLADSFETALGLADGIAVVEFADEKDEAGAARRILFSEKFACPVSGFTIPEIVPRLFSFNNPFGACPACDGLGVEQTIDPDLVVPDRARTLSRAPSHPGAKSTSPYYGQTLDALARHYGFKLTTPFADLPERAKEVILYGSGEEQITFAMMTACAPTRPPRPSKASSAISTAAGARRTATGRGRRSQNTSQRCPAPPAMASV